MPPFLFSGHKIDDGLTPIYRQDSGGSFFTGGAVLYDQELRYIGSASVRQVIKFAGPASTLFSIFTGVPQVSVDTVPLQWHEDRPANPPGGAAAWSVRYIQDDGPEPFSFTPAALGVWVTLVTDRQWIIDRPGFLGVVENTSIYQIAKTADVTDVLAQAEIKLVYERI